MGSKPWRKPPPDLQSADHDIAALVARINKGDEEAFHQMVLLTQSKLIKVCFFLTGSRHAASELAQEVYLKAFENIEKLDGERNLMGWLYQVARNLVIDQSRTSEGKVERAKVKNEVENQEVLESFTSSSENDLKNVIELQTVLNQMEPEDRWLMVVFFIEGRTSQEIGKILGIGDGATRMRISRAKKIFLEIYGKN